MMTNDKMVKVTNRSNSLVGYHIPELHVKRRFAPNETKTLAVDEIYALHAQKGGKALIKNHLVLDDQDLVNELIYNVQPEYYYTAAEVQALLLHGSNDQLLDALDFAPEGVVEMIKNEAVKSKLNDVRKREIIMEKTGFNVTKAIEANAESEKVVVAPTGRRAAPVSATPKYATLSASEPEAASEAPARRTAAPRYSVNVKNN